MSDQPKCVRQTIIIPDDVSFSSLKLRFDDSRRGLIMDWEPIKRICAANGIEFLRFVAREENYADFVMRWYLEHVKNGGARDPVYETIIAIGRAQRAYPPGHA